MLPRGAARNAGLAASVAFGLAVAAGPALAQTLQAPPRESLGTVPAPGAVPAPGKATGMLEGAVKKVDPGAGTVQISSGPLGIFGRTLEVNSSTQIQVEGRQGSLADLQEGAKIKASYESREGKNVATRIEVVPAQ